MSPKLVEDGLATGSCWFSFFLRSEPIETVYLLIKCLLNTGDEEEIVYIGQSKNNLLGRINSHVNDELKSFDRVFAFNVEGIPFTLDEIEHALISYYKPIHNKALKNDVNKKDFEVIAYFMRDNPDYE